MKNTTTHKALRRGRHTLRLHWKTVLATALCAAAFSQPGSAQVAPPSILQIDIANHVLYFNDTSDVTNYGTDPNAATTLHAGSFGRGVAIADIVAVNGQSVMGTHSKDAGGNSLRTAPGPGQGIADTVRSGLAVATFEILKSDGSPIGTIFVTGLAGGDAPPGSPSSATGGTNFVITGGTGAFLGVRGQMGVAANPPGVAVQRAASMTEDPANRRLNGGGTQRWVAHLIPMSAPQILTTASGPAVFHSDSSPVTAAKPAKAGEVLIVEATGLGPTVPGVDPGQPFPTDSLFQVNSPVDVTVNGRPAEVINNTGWPGLVDTYRIDFRAPPDTAKGAASIQISAAWISGAPVSIPVQ